MSKKKKSTEVEPRVLTEDVQHILRRLVKPDQDDEGDSVQTIAEKADTSTRTVYRVLAGTTKTLSLDLADRLCLAAGAHLSECRLQWPDGRVEPYV
jgi:DNA-binding transcriptional regulator/RsmH inhibitor MraZ